MKNKQILKFLLSVLILFTAFDISGREASINFNVTTKFLYDPGEKGALTVYSYSYDRDNPIPSKVNFKFELFRINDIYKFYTNQTSRYNIDVLGKDSSNLISLTTKVYDFNKKLSSTKDFDYRHINETINFDIPSKGAYLIRLSHGNKVAYTGFIVSSLGLVSKAGSNSMLAYVIDRKSGAPVNNAELNFYIGDRQIGHGVTDNGIFFQEINPEVKVIDEEEDPQPVIIGKQGDDIVLSDPYLYFGYGDSKLYIYAFTNQPVYRTGLDVEFKGTIRDKDYRDFKPFENKDVTVTIQDSKNAEVYKQVHRTNSNGSFNGKYTIPEEGALGNYSILVNIGEKSYNAANFTVEQYKKPEYKVTVITDRQQYYGSDNLHATVQADYYFGSPVPEADVEYNIYKVRYYKPWWSFTEYAWWYEDYYAQLDDNAMYSGSVMIYSGSGKLNDKGRFELDYTINEDFKNEEQTYSWWRPWGGESDYRYIVQAKVVDKSRREISGTASAFVTRGGFYLSVRTDKYFYKAGDRVFIETRANDFSDKAVETGYEVNIYKSEWRDYGKEKKDLIKTLVGRTKSDGKGVNEFQIPAYSAEGYYEVEVKAKDERNNQITVTGGFYVSGEDYAWFRNMSSGGIQIMTDKDSYTYGETIKALVNISEPGAYVLITTQTDDIIYKKVEKFDQAAMLIDIPVTKDYMTNFQIDVSYVKDGVYYNSNKPVLVIPEEKFLTVQIDPSKLIYKPKEEGTVKVRVVDNNGMPVSNAEVSIGVVDESIYAIKEDNTKDIRKFFYGQRNYFVNTAFNSSVNINGSSRLITIYERFNLATIKESELATVKGRLLDKKGNPIGNATIIVDEDFRAGETGTDGNFEFKLPEGEYSISAYYSGIRKEDIKEIRLRKGEVRNLVLYSEREMNEEEMDNMGIRNLETFASKTEGVVKDERSQNINIRGGRTADSEIIVDGLVEPELRSDFRDAIFWSPYSMTDANGYADVNIKYPDNLTTWRITSRVITPDTRVGQETKTVITRKDLLVRMETPRFFQDKDEVTITTIIHNYLSTAKSTKVKFKAGSTEGGIQLLNKSAEETIMLQPNTDQKIDWKIKVNGSSGEAKLYVEALTNEESDAVELKVPVQPKGLKIEKNTIADFSDDYKAEIKTIGIPSDVDLKTAKLQFTVSPSLASTILTALDELAGYPYGCVEQTMSRFLPTVVVATAFKELNAPISEATQSELPKMVDKGLQRLYSFQHSDGGWGWWQNDGSNPFMSAYVVYGLSLARNAGYQIKDNVISNGVKAVRNLLNNDLDPTTRAYMLYALAVAGERDEQFFKREIDKIIASKDLNDYGRGLIAMTWQLIGKEEEARNVLSALSRNVKETGEGAAYWEGKQFHYNWQDDKVQTTAMGLKAIMNIDKNSSLKDKIVRWLMSQRLGFGWRNTQETAMVIYAMVDYLKNSNELNPDYNVKVTVNGKNVFDKQMTRDDVFKKDVIIKVDNGVIASGNNEIKIEKSGSGKVYFSANTVYYSEYDARTPKEDGFRVEKEYFKLEKYESYSDDQITYRKKYFDGSLESGDMILVKIKVHSKESDLQYFMLEDPLPSGIEVVKDDWAFQIEDENNYSGYPYYYWRWWYADKEIRDDRVTFFATHIGKGEMEFSYIFRAQIPGDYSINPAKGMLMYYPEYYGSSGAMSLKISE